MAKMLAVVEIDIPDDDSLWDEYSRMGDFYGNIQRRATQELFRRVLSARWEDRVRVLSADWEEAAESIPSVRRESWA